MSVRPWQLSFRGLGFVAAAASLLLAHSAAALPATFTGTLRLGFGDQSGVTVFDRMVSGSGTADITTVAGTVDSVSNLSAGAFVFEGPTLPVTDPVLYPITRIRLDAQSLAGSFSSLTSGGGGSLGIDGAFDVTLFLNAVDITFLTYDGEEKGIGLGGSFNADVPDGTAIVLAGAPWTTGSVSNAFGSASGTASGNSVRLVTSFTYTFVNPILPYPGIAVLDLNFVPVPEPGTAALLGIGVALLARRRSFESTNSTITS